METHWLLEIGPEGVVCLEDFGPDDLCKQNAILALTVVHYLTSVTVTLMRDR